MKFKRRHCGFSQPQLPDPHHTMRDQCFSFLEDAKSNQEKEMFPHLSMDKAALVTPRPLPSARSRAWGPLLLLKTFYRKTLV